MSKRYGDWITLVMAMVICTAVLLPTFSYAINETKGTSLKTDLNPLSIPKFVNQINGPPPVFVPTKISDPVTGQMSDYYSIIETEVTQQILPAYDPKGDPTGFKSTNIWGYGGLAKDAVTNQDLGFVRGSPSATIEATRGTPVNVAWVNGIVTPLSYTMDSTLDPNYSAGSSVNRSGLANAGASVEGAAIFPVTTTTHLQGAEVSSKYDGVPYSWVSWSGLHGSDYYSYARTLPNAAVYHYDNLQAPGTLWFHDRAFGLTRSNVYSGLSGFYLLRDAADPIAQLLPSGKYEVPLSIQDRNFYSDGSLRLPIDTEPDRGQGNLWLAQYYGEVMTVTGLAWPNMNVDQGQYLFKVLDGSDARWYDLSMSNGMAFTVIAADSNYLKSPVTTTSITVAPGERYDVLVDFSGYPAGTELVLTNKAKAPYPDGTAANPGTDGVIMKFTVGGQGGNAPKALPQILNPTLATGTGPNSTMVQRTFTLIDYSGESGGSMSLLDGQLYKSPISEYPKAGTTEIWRIVDATRNSHQIHLDLVNFQPLGRQIFDVGNYVLDWLAANGGSLPLDNQTKNVELGQYLIGDQVGPAPIENGLKDSIRVDPGEVVTILVRFAPSDDRTSFSFDPTEGPTYIWNSNIFDHEENEMIRQFRLVP